MVSSGHFELSVLVDARYRPTMNTIAEIESAIERLPEAEVVELVRWLERFCQQLHAEPAFDVWLAKARGAATEGLSTQDVMSLTRGDA